MPWLGSCRNGSALLLHVQPGARRTAVVGLHGERLKIAVTAPPVDGKANREIEKLLAGVCGCAVRDVTVVGGHGCRQKRVEICGLTAVEVRQKIAAVMAGS